MNLTAGQDRSHGVFPGPLLGTIVVFVDVRLVQPTQNKINQKNMG